jgi:hypothetical protein
MNNFPEQEYSQLPKEYYKKEFKLDNNNAVLYYGADNKPNLEQMVLCFG